MSQSWRHLGQIGRRALISVPLPRLKWKQLVVRAFSSGDHSRWSYLRDQITSIVFLGTPHRGSEWANRLYLLCLGTSVFRPGSRFVPLLRKGNSALLATITERFNNYWGDRPILTFCEGKGTGPLGLVRNSTS